MLKTGADLPFFFFFLEDQCISLQIELNVMIFVIKNVLSLLFFHKVKDNTDYIQESIPLITRKKQRDGLPHWRQNLVHFPDFDNHISSG